MPLFEMFKMEMEIGMEIQEICHGQMIEFKTLTDNQKLFNWLP